MDVKTISMNCTRTEFVGTAVLEARLIGLDYNIEYHYFIEK